MDEVVHPVWVSELGVLLALDSVADILIKINLFQLLGMVLAQVFNWQLR